MREVEGVVGRLGGRGDGVVDTDRGRFYVPYTVPGDRVRIALGKARGDGFAADLREVMAPGPDRVEPGCQHFHACGGCTLQQLAPVAYGDWKRDLVVQALARRDLAPAVAPLFHPPPHDRRRAEFVARRVPKGVLLGFHERESLRVVDVADCLVLNPALVALLPGLRAALKPMMATGDAIDVHATVTESGIDLVLSGTWPRETLPGLSALADELDLARLSLRGRGWVEPVAVRRTPVVRFGGVGVTPPPAGFLQASPAAEQALTGLVRDFVGAARHVVDLYAGCGTFTLPLAAGGAVVRAYDDAAPAIGALTLAAGQGGLGGRVKAEVRDLSRRPLDLPELKKVEAVLFDPPRAGAREQTALLAKSDVPVVAAVSCDPSSFARDARLLVDGGYRLESVHPVDQFPHTGHVELAAVFRR